MTKPQLKKSILEINKGYEFDGTESKSELELILSGLKESETFEVLEDGSDKEVEELNKVNEDTEQSGVEFGDNVPNAIMPLKRTQPDDKLTTSENLEETVNINISVNGFEQVNDHTTDGMTELSKIAVKTAEEYLGETGKNYKQIKNIGTNKYELRNGKTVNGLNAAIELNYSLFGSD